MKKFERIDNICELNYSKLDKKSIIIINNKNNTIAIVLLSSIIKDLFLFWRETNSKEEKKLDGWLNIFLRGNNDEKFEEGKKQMFGQIKNIEKQIEPYLNKMTHDIESGHEINRYVIFDREENAIEIEAA